MKNIWILALVTLAFGSCQKESSVDSTSGSGGTGGTGGGTTGSIIGTWKFVNAINDATATVIMDDGTDIIKTVSLTKYTTENNKGTVTFTADKMIYKDLSYSVNFTTKGYFYVNADLVDSVEAPFTFTLPAYNAETPYTRIGADSLVITGGSLSVPSGGSGGQTQTQGFKYRFEGNKLILYANFKNESVVDVGGDPATQSATGTLIMNLQK